jgi:hypothetical protein
MAELGDLLSEAMQLRLSGAFSYGSKNIFRVPVVGGIPRDDLSVLADQDGGERVCKGLIVSRSNADVEILCNRWKIFFRGSRKVPVKELFVGVVAGISAAVAAKYFGCVVRGIEADADEVSLFVERRIGSEGFVDIGEVVRHAWTEVGELAAGVDKGNEDDLPLELVKMDGAIALVEEMEVGDLIAGRRYVVRDGGFVIGTSLGDDDDVVELNIAVICAIRGCKNLGGDAIAWVKFTNDAGILQLVVHRHCFHEAGNAFAIEGDVSCIGGNDFTADRERLLRCVKFDRHGCLWKFNAFAADQQDEGGKEKYRVAGHDLTPVSMIMAGTQVCGWGSV